MSLQYKAKKTEYFKRVESLLAQNNYFAIVCMEKLPSDEVYLFLEKARKEKIESLLYRKKIIKNIDPFFKGVPCENGTYILFSEALEKIIAFLKENSFNYIRFLKDGQISEKEIVLTKGPTKIKAGVALKYFQRIGNIKITKGYLQLLEQVKLVEKNGTVSDIASIVLRFLKRKEKIVKSKVLNLSKKDGELKLISPMVQLLLIQEPNKTFEQTFKLLNSLKRTSHKTFRYNLPEKIVKITSSIKLLNKNRS